MFLHWCGWEVPDDVDEEEMVETWPPNIQGWHTGYGHNYDTWVGCIWAESPEDAEHKIRLMYGEEAERIRIRWHPERKPDDYIPGNRFPGFKLTRPS